MLKNLNHIVTFICAGCAVAAWLIGCGTVRVERSLIVRADDWLMYGGSVGRTNVASYEVRPPLTQHWEYEAGGGFGGSSPAVTDSMVIVGTLSGELHVVSLRSGKRAGYSDLGAAIVGTPVIEGDAVYVALTRTRRSLVAYDVRTGEIIWGSELGDIETSPLVLSRRLYVTTMDGRLICANQTDGNVKWTFSVPSDQNKTAIRSSPAADSTAIFFGADDGKLYAVALADGKLRWTVGTDGSVVAAPTVRDGRVYVGSLDNHLYAVEAATGIVVWKRNLGSRIYGSQAVDEQRVVVGTADGTVFCLDAASGDIRWQYRAKSVVNSAPMISGKVVFIGSLDKSLYAIDADTGALLWTKAFEGRIRGTPVVWKNELIIQVEDRSIIALKSEGGM